MPLRVTMTPPTDAFSASSRIRCPNEWFGRRTCGQPIAGRGDGQVAHPNAAAEWREYQRAVQPFFAKHCFACHADKESGDVRLDRFTNEAALAKGLATVEKAMEMLRKRAMPPKKRPQPG